MAQRLPVLVFLLLITGLIELYVFNGIAPFIDQLNSSQPYWIVYSFILFLSFFSIFALVRSMSQPAQGVLKKSSENVLSGMALTLMLTKLSFILAMFAEDLYRGGLYGFGFVASHFHDSASPQEMVERSVQFAQFGLGLASIPLISFMHGITLGKYKFQVKKVRLFFEDLPAAFDGYKVVQFSDMHSGSFDNLKSVQKGFNKIQEQEPDLILFTGDMVNNEASEVEPFIPALKDLKAKDGKFSILGNHDYGDYIRWASNEQKIHNLYQLIHHQESAGFKMLLNEHVFIEKDGQRIALAGVENWGKPPFTQHGDLQKALDGVASEDFVLLMSHDPSHWEYQVINNQKKIHLTMSGHTHGMQFGLDIKGLKWSPVKFKYPRWSGLYEELGRRLYVNNGFGFLGFPGRVGIYPEITAFELKKGKA